MITIVTSAFLGLRQDRPAEYYLDSLQLMLPKLPCPCVIYTQERFATMLRSLAGNKASVVSVSLDAMVRQVWDEPRWAQVYGAALAKSPTLSGSAQRHNPQLIGAWLAKAAIIRHAAQNCPRVLWMDAGHWVSCYLDHNHRLIKPTFFEDRGLTEWTFFAEEIAWQIDACGILGHAVEHVGTVFQIPRPAMTGYARGMGIAEGAYLAGGLLGLRQDRAGEFFDGVRAWWGRLVQDNQWGTEENAWTLAGWQDRWASLTYVQWMDTLRGKTPTARRPRLAGRALAV